MRQDRGDRGADLPHVVLDALRQAELCEQALLLAEGERRERHRGLAAHRVQRRSQTSRGKAGAVARLGPIECQTPLYDNI